MKTVIYEYGCKSLNKTLTNRLHEVLYSCHEEITFLPGKEEWFYIRCLINIGHSFEELKREKTFY